jgi:uncharacterized protein (TIGR02231 family)
MLEAEATTMLTLLLALGAADPAPLATTIRDVTLYGDSALVHRTGALAGGGEYLIQGLPACLDADKVRVRCEGGDVVDVETRERLQQTLPSERLQALRARLEALQREQQLALDAGGLLEQQARHLERMRSAEAGARAPEGSSARPGVEAWSANFDFLARKSGEVSRAQRENAWKLEELAERLAAAQHELGSAQSQGAVTVHDVRVSVEARGPAALHLEYLVSNTGWRPAYDLRAQKTLDKVELSYRAKVWQRTGEDWNDVALALSSARPQIGAQGPEPVAAWVGIAVPQSPAPERRAAGRIERKSAGAAEALDRQDAPRPFAAVESEGLSVRFELSKPVSIQSRAEPATLLVGEATLAIRAERQCVPALDTTVWLRGKALNSSPWTLLPGTAAVFFGADYLGPAEIGAVQPGQELVLHLGADPGLSVERTQTEDLSKGPGFLSSSSSDVKSWRVHLANHGTLGAAADGSVEVILREVLPRPRDERVEVELSKSSQPESDLVRWKQDREERGIHTWVLRVPRGEQGSDLVWQRTIRFPKGAEIGIE